MNKKLGLHNGKPLTITRGSIIHLEALWRDMNQLSTTLTGDKVFMKGFKEDFDSYMEWYNTTLAALVKEGALKVSKAQEKRTNDRKNTKYNMKPLSSFTSDVNANLKELTGCPLDSDALSSLASSFKFTRAFKVLNYSGLGEDPNALKSVALFWGNDKRKTVDFVALFTDTSLVISKGGKKIVDLTKSDDDLLTHLSNLLAPSKSSEKERTYVWRNLSNNKAQGKKSPHRGGSFLIPFGMSLRIAAFISR